MEYFALAGPAAVVVASLLRVGWSCASPTEWVTPTGDRRIVTDLAPRDVARLVSHSALQWYWSQASQRHVHMSHLDRPPFLSPIVRLLAEDGIDDFGTRQKAALQALRELCFTKGHAPFVLHLAPLSGSIYVSSVTGHRLFGQVSRIMLSL